jgi:tetratricopeptide (TPR) repeat protein
MGDHGWLSLGDRLHDLLRSTQEARAPLGTGLYLSRFLVDLGNAYMAAGRLGDARASADRALALTREQGQRGHETHALRLLGEIASRGDPLDAQTAEGYYRQALALATELEMRPLVAHCHLSLGRLYRRTGDRAKGDDSVATAITMYREMDMGFWLEQAEAALGPPHENST